MSKNNIKKKSFYNIFKILILIGLFVLSTNNPMSFAFETKPINKPITYSSSSTSDLAKESSLRSNSTEYNEDLSVLHKDKNLFSDNPNNKVQKPPSILKLLFSLLVVIGLIFLMAWIYSKLRIFNTNALLSGKFQEKNLNVFNILSTASLGQGKSIHLVEINGKKFVIGSTTNNINLLTEFEPEYDELIYSNDESLRNNTKTQTEFNTTNLVNNPDLYKDYLKKD